MAKAPIQIGVASDTKAFRQGIETGVIKPIEDAEDSLKEFGKAGNKSGDQLEAAMKDAQRETDETRADLDRLGDSVERSAAKARKLGDGFEDGTDRAKQELGELKDEAIQNASETFSSFDGSIDSLVDGIQGTLGGVISNIGPLGAVAGAAAAIGVGLLTAELQKSAERAEEIREEASELAKQMIETGGALDAETVSEKIREWSFEIQDSKEWFELWQESAVTNLGKVDDVARKTGLSAQDLFDTMSGQDASKSLDMIDDMESKAAELDSQLAKLAASKMGGTARASELRDERDALRDGSKAIRERIGIQETATDDARRLTELTKESTEASERAAAAEEARADAIGSLQGALDDAIGSFGDYINAESGVADPEAYIKAMRKRTRATETFNENVQLISEKFGFTQDEMQALLDQGIDFAPMLQAIVDADPKIQEQYAKAWKAAIGGGQEIVDGQPISASVTVEADTGTAEKQLDATTDQARTAEIDAKANAKPAQESLQRVSRAKYQATITAVAEVAAARRTLNELVRTREATIIAKVQDREGRALL